MKGGRDEGRETGVAMFGARVMMEKCKVKCKVRCKVRSGQVTSRAGGTAMRSDQCMEWSGKAIVTVRERRGKMEHCLVQTV